MRAALLALLPMLAAAQETARLEYTCTAADVDKFGLTCSDEEPCPVFLELAAVDGLGSRIIAAGNLHTVTTTLYGLLLVSDDGGKTWTEPSGRIRSAALDQIRIPDLQHAWITGVILDPLPRDPFLMASSDAGKTWRRRPLFEDARFGAIQQIWFDSAKTGELIVERSASFELYETRDGGDVWSVKEVSSKPLKLSKAPATENPTWRVRADAPSKTYRIERRTTERWESLAAFSVEAGVCK